MTKYTLAIALGLAGILFCPPAIAKHPGANLDKVMTSKERYFQVMDKPSAPPFDLADADGNRVRLSDFADKVVVLNFIFASCGDVCPLHSERISKIQEMVNASPAKHNVQFLSITTDPRNDTSAVLKGYAAAHGLEPSNWMFLTTQKGQPDDTTRKLAADYKLQFTPTADGQQLHAVVTHVIDRGGRFAAKFHSLRFTPVNMVLYINGLINNRHAPATRAQPGFWDKVKGVFQ